MFFCSLSDSDSHTDGPFPAKKASKFRDWLDCSTLELKPNSMAMEILSYLAYETVAQACEVPTLDVSQQQVFSVNMDAVQHLFIFPVVFCSQIMDLSLLVKQEMTVKTNPISHVISASYIHYNTHSEVPYSQLKKRLCEIHHKLLFALFLIFLRFVLQLKKDPDSPEATPPSTPSSSHTSKPLLQGNGSLDGRARQRKRKKVCN